MIALSQIENAATSAEVNGVYMKSDSNFNANDTLFKRLDAIANEVDPQFLPDHVESIGQIDQCDSNCEVLKCI